MMDEQRLYLEWKEKRRKIEVPDDFSTRVMDAVYASKTARRSNILDDTGFDQLMIRFSDRRATAAALLMLGLFRMIYWAGQFFSVGSIAP
jgi:predicted HTH transcriptional regulator